MSSPAPSPSRSNRDKHFPSKLENHVSESPKKKLLSGSKDENETGGSSTKALPVFRGPEGSIKYNIKELKKITVRIERSFPKPEVAREIIDPKSIAPVRRPEYENIEDEIKDTEEKLFSKFHDPVQSINYQTPARHSSRHSPGGEERRRSSRRTHSPERNHGVVSTLDKDKEKRERRRSVSRSPHRNRRRSPEDDRYHEGRHSPDIYARGRSAHHSGCDRSREPSYLSRYGEHSYHPGMMPMVMGPVVHPFPHYVPPFMVRPPPPGFRPFPPGVPFRPQPFGPPRYSSEGQQPLFSRIAECAGQSSTSGEPGSSSNTQLEGDKRKSRSRSPDNRYRHRSRKRSGSSSSRRRYQSPSPPPHYRHRHSSRHSPGREERRRSSRRTHSPERNHGVVSTLDKDKEKRERRRSVSRSPHRNRRRSPEDDRYHEGRHSPDIYARGRSAHHSGCDRSREPSYLSRYGEHSYHPGMMPMVMGPVVHPFPHYVPPFMVRPPPPGFRPFRPGVPFRPLPFGPLRNPRYMPPRLPSSNNEKK